MSASFPIKEFRFTSLQADIENSTSDWVDIDDLILTFDENDNGYFLVTLVVNGYLGETAEGQGESFQVVLRTGRDKNQLLGKGAYVSYPGTQLVSFSFSLVCQAEVSPNNFGSAIVAQWKVAPGRGAFLTGGSCSLSAVGSLAPIK